MKHVEQANSASGDSMGAFEDALKAKEDVSSIYCTVHGICTVHMVPSILVVLHLSMTFSFVFDNLETPKGVNIEKY